PTKVSAPAISSTSAYSTGRRTFPLSASFSLASADQGSEPGLKSGWLLAPTGVAQLACLAAVCGAGSAAAPVGTCGAAGGSNVPRRPPGGKEPCAANGRFGAP